MFANYLIGLREGLEAALVVSILIAYLVKTDNRDKLPLVWAGVGFAVGISVAFGAALTFTSQQMSFQAQEAFGGIMSIVAVGFVTWMIFWMRRTARGLSGELRNRMDAAISVGGIAVAVIAFIAVAREGLETSLFIWAAVQSTGSGSAPLLGAALGLATAVVLGYLFYKGAVKINLAKFFTWTGFALIIIAAGVLAYGVHDLQEAGILPGLNNVAWDATAAIPPSSWYGSLLKGIFNLSPAPSVLEVIVWFAYVIPVSYLFFRKPRVASQPANKPVATATDGAPAATAAAKPAAEVADAGVADAVDEPVSSPAVR